MGANAVSGKMSKIVPVSDIEAHRRKVLEDSGMKMTPKQVNEMAALLQRVSAGIEDQFVHWVEDVNVVIAEYLREQQNLREAGDSSALSTPRGAKKEQQLLMETFRLYRLYHWLHSVTTRMLVRRMLAHWTQTLWKTLPSQLQRNMYKIQNSAQLLAGSMAPTVFHAHAQGPTRAERERAELAHIPGGVLAIAKEPSAKSKMLETVSCLGFTPAGARAMSAYHIGLLRIWQATKQLKAVERNPQLSEYSSEAVEARQSLEISTDVQGLMQDRSIEAQVARRSFVFYRLMDIRFWKGETMITYLFYVCLLTLLAFNTTTSYVQHEVGSNGGGDGGALSYYFGTAVGDTALGNFEEVGDVESFWAFAVDEFAETMFASSDGYFETNNKLIGAVRLRQLRARQSTCDDTLEHQMFPGHRNPNSTGYSDNTCYYDSWDRSSFSVAFDENRTESWGYAHSKHPVSSYSSSAIGRAYPQGGYIVDLPAVTPDESKARLAELRDAGWIDKSTRAVFIEFAAYNPSIDRVFAGTLSVELPESGGGHPHYAFSSVPGHMMLDYRDVDFSAYSGFMKITQALIFFSTLKIMVDEIRELNELTMDHYQWEGKSEWKIRAYCRALTIGIVEYADELWNGVDLFAAIFALIWQYYNFKAYMNISTLEYDDMKFIDLHGSVMPDMKIANDYIAMGVILNWLKLLKYFRLIPSLGPMIQASTLSVFNFQVFAYLAFYLYFTLAVCMGCMVAFGGDLDIYSGLLTAYITSFQQMLGDEFLEDMQGQRFDLGTGLYLILAIMGGLVLTNLFVGVVGVAYEEKLESSQENYKAELEEMMGHSLLDQFRVRNKARENRHHQNWWVWCTGAVAWIMRGGKKQETEEELHAEKHITGLFKLGQSVEVIFGRREGAKGGDEQKAANNGTFFSGIVKEVRADGLYEVNEILIRNVKREATMKGAFMRHPRVHNHAPHSRKANEHEPDYTSAEVKLLLQSDGSFSRVADYACCFPNVEHRETVGTNVTNRTIDLFVFDLSQSLETAGNAHNTCDEDGEESYRAKDPLMRPLHPMAFEEEPAEEEQEEGNESVEAVQQLVEGLRAELELTRVDGGASNAQTTEGEASHTADIQAMRSEMDRLAQQNEEIKQESRETKEMLQKLLGGMEVLMQK
jgi:hypothetical protein